MLSFCYLRDAFARLRAVLFHAALLAFCVCYVFAGALLFRAIERPHELKLRAEVEHTLNVETSLFLERASFLQLQKNISFVELVAPLIDDYQYTIFKELKNPVKESFFGAYNNNGSQSELWSLPMALLFTTTSIVPVGFGFVTPLTRTGRCLLVLYSIIGLPLALVTLSDFSKFLCALLLRFLKNVRGAMLAVVVLLAAYPIFGAILIHLCTELPWTESFYFCIASMFTIGYGDIFPSFPLGYLIVFVVSGVLLMTAAIDLLASELIHNIHYLGRRMNKAKRLAGRMFQLAAQQMDTSLVGTGLSQLNSFARTNAATLLRLRGKLVMSTEEVEEMATMTQLLAQKRASINSNSSKQAIVYRQYTFEPPIELEFVDI